MKVIAVTEQFGHHNIQSSPDYLTNFINYDKVIRLKRPYSPDQRIGRINKKFNSFLVKLSGMGGYREHSFFKELKALENTFLRKYLVHFYAGDATYKFFQYFNLRSKAIATYHQPPEMFHKFIKEGRDSHIKKLDALLVTSRILEDFLCKYMSRDRIYFCPLPVDTETFIPAEIPRREKKICIFLGSWLRDFETMNKVAMQVRHNKNIEFQLITDGRNRRFFDPQLKNVKFFSGIPFPLYLEKLQNADMLVLPFISCTSNLSILESISAGLPVISTDTGGIRDYVNDSFARLSGKGDYKDMSDSILELCGNDRLRKEMSTSARNHAVKNFDFKIISEKMKSIYTELGAVVE